MAPSPDVHAQTMPAHAETLFTFVTGVPLLIAVALGVGLLVRRRDPLLLLCLAGGALASLFEPVADLLCNLYFPGAGQHTAYETFGRPIPWALVLAYPWYVGGQGYLTYRLFARGVRRRALWLLWLGFALSDVACETPGVLSGFHVYYGTQPLNPYGFPFWMAAVQSLMPMIAGGLVYAVRTHIGGGWRLLLVVPLIPMADGMANAGLALPIWTTLNSGSSLLVNYVGAGLAIGMAAVAVWVLSLLLGRVDTPPSAPPASPPVARARRLPAGDRGPVVTAAR